MSQVKRCGQCGGIVHPRPALQDYGRILAIPRATILEAPETNDPPACLCSLRESCEHCRTCYCPEPEE